MLLHRELLIEGNGVARNSDRNRIRDQVMVDAAILVMPVKLQPSCWSINSSITQVCFCICKGIHIANYITSMF
jgi:hypothetical protein